MEHKHEIFKNAVDGIRENINTYVELYIKCNISSGRDCNLAKYYESKIVAYGFILKLLTAHSISIEDMIPPCQEK